MSFAHGIAFGLPMSRALFEAGYDNASNALGRILLLDPRIQEVIAKDREWKDSKLMQSKEALAAQLDADREFAYTELQPAAAVAATMGKAKLLGLLDQVSGNRLPSKITISWGEDSQEVIHPTGTVVEEASEDA